MRQYLGCVVVFMIGGLGVLNAFGVLNLELTSASTSAISIRVESGGTNSQEKEILGIMSKDLSHTNKIGLKKKHEDAEYKLAMHTQQDQICLNIAIPQQSFHLWILLQSSIARPEVVCERLTKSLFNLHFSFRTRIQCVSTMFIHRTRASYSTRRHLSE